MHRGPEKGVEDGTGGALAGVLGHIISNGFVKASSRLICALWTVLPKAAWHAGGIPVVWRRPQASSCLHLLEAKLCALPSSGASSTVCIHLRIAGATCA